ncbi:hypothetical protein QCA50_014811 [Cerrena zonata]|uniref:F-box domain-containing protein n=1 Tax=Cerrena zonata TaxID=2478898 RepID=A0AAW0FVB8_9APHY
MARPGGNMESLMLALGRKARTCSLTTRFEDLHNVTLDYVMIGLETETICALLKQFNDTEVPIHHLPDKVIFRIFEAFWGTYEELSYQWLLITVVCKRWRSLALSCPRLWSVLHFDVMPLKAASRFVELSSDVPMKWIIPNYKRLEQRHEDFHAKFSDLLASSMNRIEHLDIDLGGHDNFLDLLKEPASKLKYLRICGKAPVPKVKTDETLLPALNTAPRLQHFILESDISWARTPLKRLISFISVWQNFGDSSSTSTFLQTLRKSPSLSLLSLGTMQNGVDLELTLPPSLIEYRVDQSKIHLSNIGKVVLTYMSLHSLRRLTSMIKAPESTNSVIGMTTSNGTPAVLVDVFLSFPVPIPEPGHVILLINRNPSIYRYNVIVQDNGDTLPPRFWHRNVFPDTSALLSDSRLAGALSLTIHYPRPFTTPPTRSDISVTSAALVLYR